MSEGLSKTLAPCRGTVQGPGQVARLLRRPHAHGLLAKIPQWRVSLSGRRTMTIAIKLREVAYPSRFAAA
jgi:hypothetical protein